MATTNLASYKAIDQTTDICVQWLDIEAAIEGMAAVYQSSLRDVTPGAEPDDVLVGWVFGDGAAAVSEYRLVGDTTDLTLSRNTGTDVTPIWDRIAEFTDLSTKLYTADTLRLTLDATALTSTLPFYGADGVLGGPGFAFASAPTTGIFRDGSAQLAIVHTGFLSCTFSSSGIVPNVGIFQVDGGTATPSYTFATGSTTGMFLTAGKTLGFSHLGAQMAEFAGTGITSSVRIFGVDGTSLAPSFAFTGEVGTGLSRPGGGQVIISGNAQTLAHFRTSGVHGFTHVRRTRVVHTTGYTPTVAQVVDWDSAQYNQGGDALGHWDSGGTVSNLTTKSAGLYFVAASWNWDTSGAGAGDLFVEILVDGTPTYLWTLKVTGSDTTADGSLADEVELTSGQVLTMRVTSANHTLNSASMTLNRINDVVA